jgi:isopenicillin N synthase-like dioxygenase
LPATVGVATAEVVRDSGSRLPIIDIGGLSSPHLADRTAVAAELRAACSHNGFFYIRNHGIAETLVDAVFAETERLFALPAAAKAAVAKAQSSANRGYEPLDGQTLQPGAPPDLKEGFYIGPEHTPDDPRVCASSITAPTSGRAACPPSVPPWRPISARW